MLYLFFRWLDWFISGSGWMSLPLQTHHICCQLILNLWTWDDSPKWNFFILLSVPLCLYKLISTVAFLLTLSFLPLQTGCMDFGSINKSVDFFFFPVRCFSATLIFENDTKHALCVLILGNKRYRNHIFYVYNAILKTSFFFFFSFQKPQIWN